MNTRTFEGTVVSTKMAKTAVVVVKSVRVHPKYHKRYTVARRYKVHDEKGVARVGQKVTFVECRPISKEKRWRLIYSV